MRPLTRLPSHTFTELHHGNTRVHDQVAVLRHPVRNRNPCAEKGIGDLFAPEHAVNIVGSDIARVHQQLPCQANRCVLATGLGNELHAGVRHRFHDASRRANKILPVKSTLPEATPPRLFAFSIRISGCPLNSACPTESEALPGSLYYRR